MRKETVSITERTLMYCVAGQLYEQAPNRQPRKANVILSKLRDKFREQAFNSNEYYTLGIEKSEIYEYLESTLKSIPEFNELNLTQIEYDKGVSVDAKDRMEYSFSSMYDKENSESWKRDFIDLDAFIRNVHCALATSINLDKECDCCVHFKSNQQKDIDLCNTCALNKSLNYNYECSRNPRGAYTFSCKYDCPQNKMICCEECDSKDECSDRCYDIMTCELDINHRDTFEYCSDINGEFLIKYEDHIKASNKFEGFKVCCTGTIDVIRNYLKYAIKEDDALKF